MAANRNDFRQTESSEISNHTGAYTRHLDPEQHTTSKRYTQKIEVQTSDASTRIKRWVRKTICFSKSSPMHDLVVGLFVNRYAFGWAV